MPILIAAFIFYIPKRKIPLKIALISIVAVPVVFYFGVRLNYSLNKEGRTWGSFDYNYAISYAMDYTFGTKEDNGERGIGQGRGGATLLLLDKLGKGNLNEKDWFGYGLRFVYAVNYEEFSELNFNITNKGSATGAFQTLITSGYLGLIAMVLFALSLILHTQNARLKYVLLGFFCWEFFFYTGILLRETALGFLLVYIVVLSGSKLRTMDRLEQNKLSF